MCPSGRAERRGGNGTDAVGNDAVPVGDDRETAGMDSVALEPDDKDWTWVVDRRCDECGFDGSQFDERHTGAAIRSNAATWTALLSERNADRLARRTRPDRWSELEYAAHVRDVYRLYTERLRLMLDTDDPLYADWDQDAAAIAGRYGDEDPVRVAAEIADAAAVLAAAFDGVAEGEWERPGRRSDGAVFTVATFARYLMHDPTHHLWDVRQP